MPLQSEFATLTTGTFEPPRLLIFTPPPALTGAELIDLTGDEGLSQFYEFRLTIRPVGGWTPGVVDAVIGQPVAFGLNATHRALWRGIILDAELEDGNEPMLRVVVGPRLAKLHVSYRPAVYRGKTVKEIVESVLAGHGISGTVYLLSTPPAPLDVVVHAPDESDAEFLLGLLGDAGYHFQFDHGAAVETLVIADCFKAVGLAPTVPVHRSDPRTSATAPGFDRRAVRRRLTPVVSAVAGHHPPTPDALLAAEYRTILAAAAPERSLAQHLGTRLARDRASAGVQARLHQQRLETQRTTLKTSGTYCLRPGEVFRFTDDSTVYRAGRIEHAAQERSGARRGGYYSTAISYLDALPVQPAVKAPRLRVGGWHAAVVVDHKGETTGPERICLDEHGRCFVRFRWGGTGPESVVPARVAQPAPGTFLPPQAGNEVAVWQEIGSTGSLLVLGYLPTAVAELPHSPSTHPAAYTVRLPSASGNGSCAATVLQADTRGGKERLLIDLPGSFHQRVAEEVRWLVEKHISMWARGDLLQQAQRVHVKAREIVLDADDSVTIRVGSSTWILGTGTASWQAGTIFLNSPCGLTGKTVEPPLAPDAPLK